VLLGASLVVELKRNISCNCRNSNNGPPFLSLVSISTAQSGLSLLMLLTVNLVLGLRNIFGCIKLYIFITLGEYMIKESHCGSGNKNEVLPSPCETV
jgi:hypothetical protein